MMKKQTQIWITLAIQVAGILSVLALPVMTVSIFGLSQGIGLFSFLGESFLAGLLYLVPAIVGIVALIFTVLGHKLSNILSWVAAGSMLVLSFLGKMIFVGAVKDQIGNDFSGLASSLLKMGSGVWLFILLFVAAAVFQLVMSKHAGGVAVSPSMGTPAQPQAGISCPNCHMVNAPDAKFCGGCGTVLQNHTFVPPVADMPSTDPQAPAAAEEDQDASIL